MTDCAWAGVTSVKPKPPSAVAARGLTPAIPAKRGFGIGCVVWCGHRLRRGLCEPDQRRLAAERGMRPSGMVIGEPGPHGGGTIGRGLERLGYTPTRAGWSGGRPFTPRGPWIHHGLQMDLRRGVMFEIEAYNRLVDTDDRREGVPAFNEKRRPVFKGR
jgi:hypothetical protein